MTDEPFYSPTYKAPQSATERRPGELLFEFVSGDRHVRCELREQGEYGFDVQFFHGHDDYFLFSRRFRERHLAERWAAAELEALERER